VLGCRTRKVGKAMSKICCNFRQVVVQQHNGSAVFDPTRRTWDGPANQSSTFTYQHTHWAQNMASRSYIVVSFVSAYLIQPVLAIKWHQPITSHLKSSGEVTFDPLSIAAVLSNPRATFSAIKLYTQYHRSSFLWPHLTMIGGTLIPLNVLVDHLIRNYSSLHPAILMCTKDEKNLTVKSDMFFDELPMNASNDGLKHFISFKSSELPTADFQIVYVTDVRTIGKKLSLKERLIQLLVFTIGILNGLALIAATIIAGFVGDVWGIVLFALFALHWLSSMLISTRQLIIPTSPPIDPNDEMKYVFYERPEGGTVVFKGRKDTIERWARLKWEFNKGPINNTLHWSWVITGTLAAISSVACMVNMSGAFQIIFLVILAYASIGEIVLQVLSHSLPPTGFIAEDNAAILNNATRSKAIIRATLGLNEVTRLKINWLDLKLLPPLPAFRLLQDFLTKMDGVDWAHIPERAEPEIQALQAHIETQNLPVKPKGLCNRVVRELQETITDLTELRTAQGLSQGLKKEK
jgi:hypothetical protein